MVDENVLNELENMGPNDFEDIKEFKAVIINRSIEDRKFNDNEESKKHFKLDLENKELDYKGVKYIAIYPAEHLKSVNGRGCNLSKFIKKYGSIPKAGMSIEMVLTGDRQEINYKK